jgi:CheY-like chemotaxis protein
MVAQSRTMPTRRTILLVEDNEDDVFLMKRALRSARILNPIQVMEDGQKAIDYLSGAGPFADRVQYPYPQIIFLDLKLPHKSGFDVLAWRQKNRDLPQSIVIVLSSSNSPQDMERVTALGAAFYSIKPPTPALFDKLTELFAIDWERKKEELVVQVKG